jgi:hydrogenase expression/formation protein HypE
MSGAFEPSPLFERVERARRRKPKIRDEQITLAHGSGGRAMHELVEGLFLDYFRNPILQTLEDQAVFDIGNGQGPVRLAFTTDSYVVTPIFFPGGDIGRLAVNGTVNDLAMSGATPLYLSAGFILEEGLLMADLKRVLESMRDASEIAGIQIVTGDTKVVEKGTADKLFINTAGIGLLTNGVSISAAHAQPGDQVIISGTIGDHGTTIMIARGELELENEIESDTAPLHSLVKDMIEEASRLGNPSAIRCLRDPTRGGVATTLNEIAMSSGVCVEVVEDRLPVREEVQGACEILGLDPLYVANEGKLIAIVAAEAAQPILNCMRANCYGANAAIIGMVKPEPRGIVSMRTVFGGTRIVDMLTGEQLPRIC